MRRPAALAAAILALAGCGEDNGDDGPGATAARPNIVLVLTDDQDVRSLRFMPAVRRQLVERGTTFTRSYTTFPLCCPARATLLSGQYAHNHGVVSNKPPDGGYQAFRGRRETLGGWLERAGYRTAWVGKYLNGYGLDGDPDVPPGWSDWRVLMGLSDLLMYGYDLNEDGTVRRYGAGPADYQTDVLARHAIGLVEEASGPRPFFLALAPLAPHDEADTIRTGARDPRPAPRDLGALARESLPRPPSFDERRIADKPRAIAAAPRLDAAALRTLRRNYLGRIESLLAVDRAVGDLIAALRATGELDETVIVYTSDNGYLLGEHRIVGGKTLPYEGMARVPLVVRGPGFGAGARVPFAAGNIDLAPTFLALAGARATRELDGESLLRLTRPAAGHHERAILVEGEEFSSVRLAGYSYTAWKNGERELYDLRRDPFELRNVAAAPAYRATAGDLAGVLAALRDCAGEECRTPPAPPTPPRRAAPRRATASLDPDELARTVDRVEDSRRHQRRRGGHRGHLRAGDRRAPGDVSDDGSDAR